MEDFLKFLNFSKNSLVSPPENIQLVLGNESCDLDSTISALILAYHIFNKQNIQNHLNNVVVPILNVSKENFLLRTENCYVLKEVGIDLDKLVYRDEINFDTLLQKSNLAVTLVDHHIPSKNDEVLANSVVQIIDHRPIDTSQKWDKTKVDIRIEQVGSCATLVADLILKYGDNNLTKPMAYLLYQTIIYDTIALLPEYGKAKSLDINIGTTLENKFNFTEDRKSLFDKLWTVHNDVSHLTPRQLLYKDLKVVEGIFIPGLPMLVEDFLKLDNAFDSVEKLANEHQITCVVLVGLDAKNGTVHRDTAVYSSLKHDKIKNNVLELLKSSKEYDFKFEERCTNFSNIVLLHIHNTKLSRKQLVPLIKEAVLVANKS